MKFRVGDTVIFSEEAQPYISKWEVKPGVKYQIRSIDLYFNVAYLQGQASPYHFDFLELVSPRMMLQDPLFSLEEITSV